MALPTVPNSTDRWQSFRVLVQLPRLVRLYWRPLRDRRVPLWPKAVLVAAHWFLQGCPPDVVTEHARALGARLA